MSTSAYVQHDITKTEENKLRYRGRGANPYPLRINECNSPVNCSMGLFIDALGSPSIKVICI